jgi:hypothetical protein
VHSRLRVLRSVWFGGLARPARYTFFQDFLTDTLKNNYELQEQVVAHIEFCRLSPEDRSELLYRLAIENSLGGAKWTQEFHHLAEAIRLHPQKPKPYLLLALSLFGPFLRKRILWTWRKVRSSPEVDDPIMRILRAKNVA